ncbi:uncharacterized protein J3D65DRAFT_606484 [Phyllosticta citribraziliensis]|uniref:Transmembrane protein n=1 Tax=Phyllosticta citribraziliensis TaxID=989973 RepID=A0ABR1LC04_9PEZI
MSSNNSTPSSSRSPSPCFSVCSSTTSMDTLLEDIGDVQQFNNWAPMPTLVPVTNVSNDFIPPPQFIPVRTVLSVTAFVSIMLKVMVLVLLFSDMILAPVSFTNKLWFGAGLGAEVALVEVVLVKVIFAILAWESGYGRRGRRNRDIAFFPSF